MKSYTRCQNSHLITQCRFGNFLLIIWIFNPRTVCPAGTQCNSNGIAATCSNGQYSHFGEQRCEVCPKSFYCPDELIESPIPCLDGYYSDPGASECTLCSENFSCEEGTGTNWAVTPCGGTQYSQVVQDQLSWFNLLKNVESDNVALFKKIESCFWLNLAPKFEKWFRQP